MKPRTLNHAKSRHLSLPYSLLLFHSISDLYAWTEKGALEIGISYSLCVIHGLSVVRIHVPLGASGLANDPATEGCIANVTRNV